MFGLWYNRSSYSQAISRAFKMLSQGSIDAAQAHKLHPAGRFYSFIFLIKFPLQIRSRFTSGGPGHLK